VCRPGPVWQSPPRAGFAVRMWDSFDHGREGQSSDERASLLGEETEEVDLQKEEEEEEEEEEFQDRSCSESNGMSDNSSPEPVLQSDATSLSPPSIEGSNADRVASHAGGHGMGTDEWECDFPSCGRAVQKRHDLK
jgi:hypothetical protein